VTQHAQDQQVEHTLQHVWFLPLFHGRPLVFR
jgi:hypothetical protein